MLPSLAFEKKCLKSRVSYYRFYNVMINFHHCLYLRNEFHFSDVHTCDELLVWKWEIWISFQGDRGLLQGDFVSASKMRDFACFHATSPYFRSNLKEFAFPYYNPLSLSLSLSPPPPPLSKCIVVLSAYPWELAYNHESYLYWERGNLHNKEGQGVFPVTPVLILLK